MVHRRRAEVLALLERKVVQELAVRVAHDAAEVEPASTSANGHGLARCQPTDSPPFGLRKRPEA